MPKYDPAEFFEAERKIAECERCTRKCQQAELAHEIAKGRMYATQELVRLVKAMEAPPTTNADRIRAMSDEELAEWHEQYCPNRADIAVDCVKESCEACWLDWLKQEVEI